MIIISQSGEVLINFDNVLSIYVYGKVPGVCAVRVDIDSETTRDLGTYPDLETAKEQIRMIAEACTNRYNDNKVVYDMRAVAE